jgi:uncharacterized iron-regulated membrane protein
MRAVAVWLHRYLGLALGALLLVSGLSGAWIVFGKQVDASLNDGLLRVQPQAGRASLEQVLAAARHGAPGLEAKTVFIPEQADLALEIWFRGTDLRAYVDPYSGALKGTRRAGDSLNGFLLDLHMHLLSGKSGEQVMGWAGLGALALCLAGLWLWWPRRGNCRKALSVKWGASPYRVWRDLHQLSGAVLCLFLVLGAGTGAALALHDVVTEPLLKALTGEGTRRKPPLSRPPAAATIAASLSAMLQEASRLYPEGRITRVGLPSRPDEAVMVRMRLPGEIHQYGRTFIWFDRYDGALLRQDSALKANLATRVQNWFYPLHTGSYGGLATRWLQLFAGLAMALLSLSGAWLFYRGWRARTAARPAAMRAIS